MPRRRHKVNFEKEQLKILLWLLCKTIPFLDPEEWRLDNYGNIISWSEYGNRSHVFGWEIDHIIPVSKNGSNDLENLQALQWRENLMKGNKYPYKPIQNIHTDISVNNYPTRRRTQVRHLNISDFHSKKKPLRYYNE